MGALELRVSERVFSKEERLDIVNRIIRRYKLNFPIPDGQTLLEASHLVQYTPQNSEETEDWHIGYENRKTIKHKNRKIPSEESISIKGFNPPTPRYELFTGENPGWIKTEVGKHHPPEASDNPDHLDEIYSILDKLMPVKPETPATPEDFDQRFSLVDGAPSYQ